MINPSTSGAIRKLLGEWTINAPQRKYQRMDKESDVKKPKDGEWKLETELIKILDCATKYKRIG